MDKDGYPEQLEMDTIRAWPYDHPDGWCGLLAYVKERWRYAEDGCWEQEGNEYHLRTGGRSGNEDLLYALMDNLTFRAMCWEQSRKGGYYIFKALA